MKPNNMPSPFHQAGFTLAEIMVGLAIGLLASLVIVQVMSVFEAQKRVTTGTADAQTNGGIALYNIARELQMAGYPLMPITDSALECTTLTFGATGITGISPASITDGVSDTITIRYGDSLSGGIPNPINGVGNPGANDVAVGSNFACQTGDITLISNGTTCAMSSAIAVPAAGAIASAVQTTITLQNNTAAVAGANLACLGAWHEVTYRINNSNLERRDLATIPNTFIPIVVGIVNLQAQYGVSTAANSNQVNQWVDASGIWAAPTVTNRNRIKAVRISVVARNAKMEPAAVTTSCSSTTAAAPSGLCAWAGSTSSPAPTINLNADADWARYRYRVFETIIPLRNMIWARSTL